MSRRISPGISVFAGHVNPGILAPRKVAVIWGVCLSVLGCCSEDDEHHFRTGEALITGISCGSIDQAWFSFVWCDVCLYDLDKTPLKVFLGIFHARVSLGYNKTNWY